MGKGKDLGGREPPLERGGSLPPNLPHSPRTSPKSTRRYMAKSCFALYGTGALGGSFLFRAGGVFLMVRLSRPVGEWGARNDMRGAPFGLRPCKARYLLEMICCRERPMCRSGSVEGYIPKGCRFIPPHQSLTRQLPPQGEAFCKISFVLHNKVNRQKYRVLFAT